MSMVSLQRESSADPVIASANLKVLELLSSLIVIAE